MIKGPKPDTSGSDLAPPMTGHESEGSMALQ